MSVDTIVETERTRRWNEAKRTGYEAARAKETLKAHGPSVTITANDIHYRFVAERFQMDLTYSTSPNEAGGRPLSANVIARDSDGRLTTNAVFIRRVTEFTFTPQGITIQGMESGRNYSRMALAESAPISVLQVSHGAFKVQRP